MVIITYPICTDYIHHPEQIEANTPSNIAVSSTVISRRSEFVAYYTRISFMNKCNVRVRR